MNGTIEIMIGPMRSNKTAELIRRVAMREEYAHQSVILFKPKDDTKSAHGVVESRIQLSHRQREAVEFDSANPWEMFAFIAERERIIGKPVNCIAVDEGQFVSELFDCARALLERGSASPTLLVNGGFERLAGCLHCRPLFAKGHGRSHLSQAAIP